MKTMKQALCILLIAAMALLAVSCGSSGSEKEEGKTSTAAETSAAASSGSETSAETGSETPAQTESATESKTSAQTESATESKTSAQTEPASETQTEAPKELAFSYDSDLNGYTVTGIGTYDGSDLVIPAEYDGKPVVSIGKNAFANCRDITSVIIPESITEIGEGAFDGCDLAKVRYTGNPKQWKAIKNYDVFDPEKTIIDKPEPASEGLKFTFAIDGDCWVAGIGSCTDTDLVIPAEYYGKPVKGVMGDAFKGCIDITSVVIPDSATDIGASAFEGCTSLTSVVIGKSVTLISPWSFRNCNNLTSVVIPESIETISFEAFYGCSSLKNVYYTGSSAEWASIFVGYSNDSLTNATKHYNYVPEA